jgi:hypothetical protein
VITVAVDEDGVVSHFVWQEQQHRVERIVQRWQIDTEWWRGEGRIWREYLALITGDKLFCVIYYDRLCDEWRLIRLYD